jgi:hypothetical protein
VERPVTNTYRRLYDGPKMTRQFLSQRSATFVSCIGVVAAGFFFQIDVFRLILAALCIGLLLRQAVVCGSRATAAKLLFLNSALLSVVSVALRVTLIYVPRHLPFEYWPWFPRMFRSMWLSECSAIILSLGAAGLAIIEVAGKIGGETLRKRFQWSVIASASVLLVINIVNFLRPVTCYDCFFPYGLPFTLFTEDGYAGGGGIVWLGLVADAVIIPIFAAMLTLLWTQTARSDSVASKVSGNRVPTPNVKLRG